jgi:hypothetical protein
MVLRALVVLWIGWISGACGRLSFDPLAGADAGPDAGAATTVVDARHAACLPKPEVCNGIDDSCDGEIDEGCPCQPFDVTLPDMGAQAPRKIAWTGTSYAVLVAHSTTIDLVILDPNGVVVTSRTLTTAAGGNSSATGVVWTGSELVAIWTDDAATASLARFSARGEPTAPSITLEDVPAAMAWAGDRLVVTWLVPTKYLAVRELALDGTTLRELTLTQTTEQVLAYIDALVVSQDDYAISWLVVDGDASYLRVDREAWTLSSFLLPPADPYPRPTDLAVRPDGRFALVETSRGNTSLHLFGADLMSPAKSIVVPPYPPNTLPSVSVMPVGAGFRVALSSSAEVWAQTFDSRTETFAAPELITAYPPTRVVTRMVSLGVSGRQAMTLSYAVERDPATVRLLQTCL